MPVFGDVLERFVEPGLRASEESRAQRGGFSLPGTLDRNVEYVRENRITSRYEPYRRRLSIALAQYHRGAWRRTSPGSGSKPIPGSPAPDPGRYPG